jgi:hypothetical protein
MSDVHPAASAREARRDALAAVLADAAPAWHSGSSVRTRAACAACGAPLYMTLAALPQMFCRRCAGLPCGGR